MTVTITQFGGHTSSFAGDCAVVQIEDNSGTHIVIIDTGDTVIWANSSALAKYVRSLTTFKNATITLVTTHFHRDHYNKQIVESFRIDEISEHVYSKSAATAANFFPSSGIKRCPLNAGATTVTIGSTASLTYYVPPMGRKPDDQNDLSMAVRVDSRHFSFLSFGDMTKEAYIRLVEHLGAPLQSATVTKYPHHGNFSANYIEYYERNLFGTGVLISGNSLSDVKKTINTLLERKVGAVYCLAGTDAAKQAFRDCWTTPNRPVYLTEGALVKEGGVSVIDNKAEYLTIVDKSMGTRSRKLDSWERVQEVWTEEGMEG